MDYETTSTRTLPRVLISAFAAFLLAFSQAAAAASEPPPRDPPPEAQKNPLGFTSMLIQKGFGEEHPDGNDYVIFNFTVWTSAGVEFQSTVGGQPVASLMEKIAPAWREGLELMIAGEKRRLWIPESLAPSNANAPKGAVVCDLELLGMRRIPNLEDKDRTPPADADRTPFGVYTKLLEKGTGSAPDASADGAFVHFTVYTEDGKVYDSTLVRDRVTLLPYDRVMPALADALKRMTPGERRRIWIPGNVANGQWVGSPKGMLIFDAKVVDTMKQEIKEVPPGVEAKSSG